ncbi:MAG: quinone-dependent dihydroorotate dehydrogenase [Actinobacteria bacterium]|nr:quinone-dependent dihydroorotate dehydrogenase [Actinomycetota bacterium]
MYRAFFNLVFSRFNPETAHYLGVLLIKFLGATGLADLTRLGSHPTQVKVMGLDFKGPFGMAAGFDKNAGMVKELGQLGFSHVEIGTVTRFAQEGNAKPRLFRLKKDLSLINRMGFNNDGADAISRRLEKLRSSGAILPVIGVNIGKSRITELEDAVSDYEYSAEKLAPFADYIAVNVSSPNTPGLRSLQAIDQLEPILKAVMAKASGKPVLVKIAPDLADEDVLGVAALATKLGLSAVIATNTTISRSSLKTDSQSVAAMGAGGLSGPVLKDRSIEVLKLLRANLPSEIAIISVGGVFSFSDVSQRLELGASLVQGYTGFVYEGPLWARKINRGLLS